MGESGLYAAIGESTRRPHCEVDTLDVRHLIGELRRYGLTEGVPDEHHVARRERRWSDELARIPDVQTLGDISDLPNDDIDIGLNARADIVDQDDESVVLDEADD